MIYCIRKILKTKYNKHKEPTFRSLRNYSIDIYKQTLERASFPNYDNFHNPNIHITTLSTDSTVWLTP